MLITLPVSLQLIRQMLITSSGFGPAKCAHGNEGRVNPNCLSVGALSEGKEGEFGCDSGGREMLFPCFPCDAQHGVPSQCGNIFHPHSSCDPGSIPGQHLAKCWDGSCSGSQFPDGNGGGDKGIVL